MIVVTTDDAIKEMFVVLALVCVAAGVIVNVSFDVVKDYHNCVLI